MRGILVRTGADQSYGGWNGPVDPSSGEFVYVPIPEADHVTFQPRCDRRYTEIEPALHNFAESVDQDVFEDLGCPPELLKRSMHLDPDYEHLTYGDVGDRRGSHIRQLDSGDLLVFYAGLRPCTPAKDRLVYAIVGIFVIDEIVNASDVPSDRLHENAHTRKKKPGASDIVVRAKPTVSGRLRRCLDIGEFRNKAYRVREDLLAAWGGLSVNDGYIQRSARPPRFLDANRFMSWFDQQGVDLIRANNPPPARDPVVIVHLRQPDRRNPTEMRSDPFWEFGSFGCTGCHMKNVMNPKRIHELKGARLAFAQGGPQGFRLVMLTPPVEVVRHANRCELTWEPIDHPFRYTDAPVLVSNDGTSDFPQLKRMIRNTDRNTWSQRFSSSFRSRRTRLREDVAAELVRVYEGRRAAAEDTELARSYPDAMPYPPNKVDQDRKRSYETFLGHARRNTARRRGC